MNHECTHFTHRNLLGQVQLVKVVSWKFFLCFDFQSSYSTFPFLGIYSPSRVHSTMCSDNKASPYAVSFIEPILCPDIFFPGYPVQVNQPVFFSRHPVLLLRIFSVTQPIPQQFILCFLLSPTLLTLFEIFLLSRAKVAHIFQFYLQITFQ